MIDDSLLTDVFRQHRKKSRPSNPIDLSKPFTSVKNDNPFLLGNDKIEKDNYNTKVMSAMTNRYSQKSLRNIELHQPIFEPKSPTFNETYTLIKQLHRPRAKTAVEVESISDHVQKMHLRPVSEYMSPECIKVLVSYDIKEVSGEVEIIIHPENTFKSLIEVCKSRLTDKFVGLDSDQMRVVSKSRLMPNIDKLNQRGVQHEQKFILMFGNEKDIAPVGYPERIPPKENHRENSYSLKRLIEGLEAGTQISPSYEEICSLYEKGSRVIGNFSVSNSHGIIEWEGMTDVSDICLSEIVKISNYSVEIYPDDKNKPKWGCKLNKSALITLLNIEKKLTQNQKKLLESLEQTESNKLMQNIINDHTKTFKSMIEESKSEFISYDYASKMLKFRHLNK